MKKTLLLFSFIIGIIGSNACYIYKAKDNSIITYMDPSIKRLTLIKSGQNDKVVSFTKYSDADFQELKSFYRGVRLGHEPFLYKGYSVED